MDIPHAFLKELGFEECPSIYSGNELFYMKNQCPYYIRVDPSKEELVLNIGDLAHGVIGTDAVITDEAHLLQVLSEHQVTEATRRVRQMKIESVSLGL